MKNFDFQILPANSSHLEEIKDLAYIIWHEHYPNIISREQINYMLQLDYNVPKLQDDLESGVFLDRLLVDDQLQGFAAYGKNHLAGQAKLHKLYLNTSYHGKGLGSAFLHHIESVCRTSGYKNIVLQVNKTNKMAIRSYLRNGYHKQQEVVVDIGQGFVMDDFLMAKNLSQVS